jgi:hypothetical protein
MGNHSDVAKLNPFCHASEATANGIESELPNSRLLPFTKPIMVIGTLCDRAIDSSWSMCLLAKLESIALKHNVPMTIIGFVKGNSLEFGSSLSIPLAVASEAWQNGFNLATSE